ncbi:MAG: hypothetical protein ACRC2W_07370 [Plesiomonas shigelloides]
MQEALLYVMLPLNNAIRLKPDLDKMKNKILLTIELTILISSLVIAAFWANDPEGNYEPFIAVLAGILALLELSRRLIDRSNKLTIPPKIYARRHLDQPHQLHFIKGLPSLRHAAHERSQELWDSGITANMMQGSYDYIDFLEDIWVKLAEFYPPLHFSGLEPREYITKYIQDRFSYHRANLEPDGNGTGGTIVGVMAGGHVFHDLEEMIDDTVCSLSQNCESFDYQDWKNKWRGQA